MILVLALLGLALVLFVTEKLPVELVALVVMSVLLASGVLTVEESLSGLSNPATVTVASMFVLSAWLYRTGALNFLGEWLSHFGRNGFWPTAVLMMVTVGIASAFINNTAAMAIFLPIALAVARDTGHSPSKLLMPLSFASMFGGICTLIGSSTNILVSTIAAEHGQKPFGMFEFSKLGLVMALVGTVYMLTIGVRLIPDRRDAADLTSSFEIADYLTEIVVLPTSKSVNMSFPESPLVRDFGVTILEVFRDGKRVAVPAARTIIRANDVLKVRCDLETIQKLREEDGIVLRPHLKWQDSDLVSDAAVLVEAVVAPNSPLEGRTIEEIRFRNQFGANVLALRHGEQVVRKQIQRTRLRGGDTLLIEARRDHMDKLRDLRNFVIVNELDRKEFKKRRIVPAVAIIVGVVAFAAAGVAPIVVTAVIGAVLMILAGCLSLDEAYQSIEWKVIFLLAGILPLGVALDRSGAALILSNLLVKVVGELGGPILVLSALYLCSSLMTEVMSNNATAVVLAPIAIVAAEGLGVDPRPFLFAVTFAASASFMSPVGYQTNTMIFGPGRYRFADFLRVGLPLNLLFWILATLLIPRFWPL
jgi:di/tricarboxylate transporter